MEKLIYDRTQFDIDLDTKKGNYDYSDLNRIEKWCEYLSEILNKFSYENAVNIKTNWQMVDVMTDDNSPVEAQMERIRNNIILLRQAFFTLPTTPNTPADLDYMTFAKANDIEKILYDIDQVLYYLTTEFVYCGVASCGQTRTWQQRFRKIKKWVSQPYTFAQFNSSDIISLIAVENTNEEIIRRTETLALPQLDKFDDVKASIDAINNAMQDIDNLVGGES